jgi:signal transduction histidine kinase
MRMRTKLLLCLLSVSCGLAALSLLAVQRVVGKQIRDKISSDLNRSVLTYEDMQAERQETLKRETALLADIPNLKALMTANDTLTIRDEGIEFYHVAGTGMLAIADASGKTVALYQDGGLRDEGDSERDRFLFRSNEAHYTLIHDRLYEVAAEPIYFGSPLNGSLLGYIAAGYEINHSLAQQVGQAAAADVVFSAGGSIMATTLDQKREQTYVQQSLKPRADGKRGDDLWLGSEHYLQVSVHLAEFHGMPIELIVLKSYDEASRYLTQLNRLLGATGLLVLIVAGLLGIYISGTITKPLERLVTGTRALGKGDFQYQITEAGTTEVRELGAAFRQMRASLLKAQQELIEAERLATIGRMASSISHDLRHYLSAVYANAEFLGYDTTRPEERAELLGEVKAGVQGMTDLIESLLIFSRTGNPLQLGSESLDLLIDRAVGMVRKHPDAHLVNITTSLGDHLEAWMDGRKVERAVYNLLLNACQAAKSGKNAGEVSVSLTEEQEWIKLYITDNGPGVAECIRVTLFDPFVSEGKQSGIGIGLTLAHHIAQEHGGRVQLEQSKPGHTVFSLSLAKTTLAHFASRIQEPKNVAALSPE